MQKNETENSNESKDLIEQLKMVAENNGTVNLEGHSNQKIILKLNYLDYHCLDIFSNFKEKYSLSEIANIYTHTMWWIQTETAETKNNTKLTTDETLILESKPDNKIYLAIMKQLYENGYGYDDMLNIMTRGLFWTYIISIMFNPVENKENFESDNEVEAQ